MSIPSCSPLSSTGVLLETTETPTSRFGESGFNAMMEETKDNYYGEVSGESALLIQKSLQMVCADSPLICCPYNTTCDTSSPPLHHTTSAGEDVVACFQRL